MKITKNISKITEKATHDTMQCFLAPQRIIDSIFNIHEEMIDTFTIVRRLRYDAISFE